jgi:hypothetical protein
MLPDDDDFSQMLKRVRAASADAPQQPPPSRTPGKGQVTKRSIATLFIVPAIVGGFVLLVLYGFASIAQWSATRYVTQAATNSGNSAARRRILQLKRLERYRLPVDTTISALEAGKILHAINRAGYDGDLLAWELPVEAKIGATTCCSQFKGNPSRLFDAKLDWTITAFSFARRGFTAEQRAFLNEVTRNPAIPLFRRISHAREVDIGGGLWRVPPDSVIGWPELPVMRAQQLRAAFLGNLAAAALDLEAGRATLAEQRVREVISVGFLLMRGARALAEEVVGGTLVSSGRYSLEALYRAVGRQQDADSVSANSDSRIAVPNSNEPLPSQNLDSALRARILDTTQLLSTRWQLALGSFAHVPCTEKRFWFLGPSATHRAMQREILDALVKYPSDERRFGMPARTAIQLLDPLSRGGTIREPSKVAQAIGRMTGTDQFEKCARLLYW